MHKLVEIYVSSVGCQFNDAAQDHLILQDGVKLTDHPWQSFLIN
jgi:hypothetical protein